MPSHIEPLMIRKKTKSPLRLWPCLLFLLVATLQSCIFEDMDSCVRYDITLKVVNADGFQLPKETVDSVNLFLFDKNGYARMVSADRNNKFTLGYSKNEVLTLVAWGNLKNDSLLLPQLSKGQKPEDVLITLNQLEDYALNPSDLFYARYTIQVENEAVNVNGANSNLQGAQAVPTNLRSAVSIDTIAICMKRIVASLTVTGQHMEKRYGTDTTGYHFVVSSPNDALNFMGQLVGDTARYAPVSTINAAGQLVTQAIRVLPTPDDGAVTVALYKGNSLLFSTCKDCKEKPLRAIADKRLEILIDFASSQVGVSVHVVPWGEVQQNTEL